MLKVWQQNPRLKASRNGLSRRAIGPKKQVHDVIHKTGSTLLIALSSDEDRATATGNIAHNFLKFGPAVLVICQRTDKQTDIQT